MKCYVETCVTATFFNFAHCPLFQKYNIMETSGTLNSMGCLKYEDVYEFIVVRNEVGVLGVATRLQADQLRCLLYSWLRQGIFLFFTLSSLVLEPAQPPCKRLPRALTCGIKLLEHEADHLQLVLRLRMHGTVPPLPPCAFMAYEGTNLPFTNRNVTSKLTALSNITPVCLGFMPPSLLIFVLL
jgi:hypothetical protein